MCAPGDGRAKLGAGFEGENCSVVKSVLAIERRADSDLDVIESCVSQSSCDRRLEQFVGRPTA